jgi:hypothetical protein
MSVGSIGGASSVYALYSQPQSAPPHKPAQTSPGQDTVHLSKAAQAALSGDADHDGDSH